MNKSDLQFTYVLTSSEYRGKGIGGRMLKYAIKEFSGQNRDIWYVTDTENVPSQRICSKVGFEVEYPGSLSGYLKILRPDQD